MTDNEKLIEQVMDVIHPRSLWPIMQEEHHVSTRARAERILGLFEKAHTPTDDEREALARLVFPIPPDATPGAFAYGVADRAILSGFRRSVVPEPSREDGRGIASFASRFVEQGEPSDARIRQAVLDGLAEASVLQSPFQPQTRELVVEQITLALRAAGVGGAR